MTRIIEVIPHDEVNWRDAFAHEAGVLEQVFGDNVVVIHHIGSTSIPGLAAKPIIDILVVLRETATIDRYSDDMEALGYRVRGECLDAEIPGTPGRFYFSKEVDGTRTHQVHACAVGHPEINNKLAFRDYLRTHPRRAAEYGGLKQDLAQQYRYDNIGYMRGKDTFIRTVLEEAQRWHHDTNSTQRHIVGQGQYRER